MYWSPSIASLLVLLFVPAIAIADVLPLSDVFAVHDSGLETQRVPDIVRTNSGGFLVAWSGHIPEGPPWGAYIFQREFDTNGDPLHVERALSQPLFPVSSDEEVRLAGLSRGKRVAVWENETGRDGSQEGIFGALFDSDGVRIGDEFPVNLQYTSGDQSTPALARSGGDFLVAWQDTSLDSAQKLISAQRFSKKGVRLGEELVLSALPEEESYLPSAAGLAGAASGDIMVVWESVLTAESETGYDVAGRIAHHDGTVSERIVVNRDRSADEGNPSVAATKSGFIVTWTRYDMSGADVYARRFTNDGNPIDDDFLVNTYTADGQYASSVAVSANGEFVIVWTSSEEDHPELSQDGDNRGLYAQAYGSDGYRLGNEFQVSTKTAGQQGTTSNKAGITFVNETDFVIVWRDTGVSFEPDINGRRFRLTPNVRLCGDAVGADLTVRVTDALVVLRASVSLSTCDLCSCDSDGSGKLSASDAQRVLRLAVGLTTIMACPACS